MKRLLIAIVSLLLAIIYIAPTAALFFGLVLTAYNVYVAGFFCLVFAWNIAKLVELLYANSTKDTPDEPRTTYQESEGDGRYEYEVNDGRITFTFKDIKDHDGRQLSRLKFMREKFFKDETN